MERRAGVSEPIPEIARDRMATHLQRERKRGHRVFTLAELSEETTLAPTIAEAVMDRLAEDSQFSIRRCGTGEIQWIVQ